MIYLCHHGIKGQQWGVRRYQNSDGSLTPEGYKHYNKHPEEADKWIQYEMKKYAAYSDHKSVIKDYKNLKKAEAEQKRKEIDTFDKEAKRLQNIQNNKEGKEYKKFAEQYRKSREKENEYYKEIGSKNYIKDLKIKDKEVDHEIDQQKISAENAVYFGQMELEKLEKLGSKKMSSLSKKELEGIQYELEGAAWKKTFLTSVPELEKYRFN